MANDKYYGYSPKKDEITPNEGMPGSGNRLDKVNPFEFRKGMDYELTSLGVSRLKESTPEEREKSTEKVLKNLENYSSYYSCLMHYETEFRNVDKKPAWKTWLKEFHEENGMKEVDKKYKNDKMSELKESIDSYLKSQMRIPEAQEGCGKYACTSDNDCKKFAKKDKNCGHYECVDKCCHAMCDEWEKTSSDDDDEIPNTKDWMEENIDLNKIIDDEHPQGLWDDSPLTILREAKGDGLEEPEEDEEPEEKTDKKAGKGAKTIAKKSNRFEKEKAAIRELLYGKGEEASMDNPEKGSLYFLKDELLQNYIKNKDKEDSIEAYRESIQLSDKQIKALENHVKKFGTDGMGNDVNIDMIKGDTIPATIQKLESRGIIKNNSIEKEETEFISQQGKEKNELAGLNMSRKEHLKLLEIIKENGIDLREGAGGIKRYYEIAKRSYLEGLSQGLGL